MRGGKWMNKGRSSARSDFKFTAPPSFFTITFRIGKPLRIQLKYCISIAYRRLEEPFVLNPNPLHNFSSSFPLTLRLCLCRAGGDLHLPAYPPQLASITDRALAPLLAKSISPR